MIVVAVVAICALAVVLIVVLGTQQRERGRWMEERRALVDRAIARHSGEVIAFDRTAKRTEREPAEPRYVEGLS